MGRGFLHGCAGDLHHEHGPQYAEKAKIAIRNVRRDGMEALKADEKKKEISEDDRKRMEDEVQKLTDRFVGETDEAAAKKEQEILTQ